MEEEYESEVHGEEMIDLKFDEGFIKWTLGVEFNLAVLNAYFEYNVSSYNSLGFGMGLAF